MNRPLISIIVPLYNSQEFFTESLASLCAQTYENIEILCIDDASSDDTPKLLQHLADRDGRIRFELNRVNHGPGWVRNRGILLSRGRYLTFFDHDDLADPCWIEALFNCIRQHGTAIAMCQGAEFSSALSQAKVLSFKDFAGPVVPVGKACNEDLFTTCLPPWLKIYDRQFIVDHAIKFAEDRNRFDDVLFHFFCMVYAKKISVVGRVLYYHRSWPGSISGQARENRDDYFDHLKTLASVMEKATRDGLDVSKILAVFLPFVRYHAGLVSSRRVFFRQLGEILREVNLPWRYRPKLLDLLPWQLRRIGYACELFLLDNDRFFDKWGRGGRPTPSPGRYPPC